MGLLIVTSTRYPARAASSTSRGENPNGSSNQAEAGTCRGSHEEITPSSRGGMNRESGPGAAGPNPGM